MASRFGWTRHQSASLLHQPTIPVAPFYGVLLAPRRFGNRLIRFSIPSAPALIGFMRCARKCARRNDQSPIRSLWLSADGGLLARHSRRCCGAALDCRWTSLAVAAVD